MSICLRRRIHSVDAIARQPTQYNCALDPAVLLPDQYLPFDRILPPLSSVHKRYYTAIVFTAINAGFDSFFWHQLVNFCCRWTDEMQHCFRWHVSRCEASSSGNEYLATMRWGINEQLKFRNLIRTHINARTVRWWNLFDCSFLIFDARFRAHFSALQIRLLIL